MRPRIRPRLPRHDRPYSTPGSRTPILESVRESLAADEASGALSIDREKGTVTAAGNELPLSPVMDRALLDRDHERRGKKPRPGPPVKAKDEFDEFRKELRKSLYADKLSKPVRYCSLTRVRLPRSFLQTFHAAHPSNSDGRAWWVPDDLLSAPENPDETPDENKASSEVQQGGKGAQQAGRAVQSGAAGPKGRAVLRADVLTPQPDTPQKRDALSAQMMGPNSWLRAKMPGGKPPVWRERMGEGVLDLLRRDVSGRLLTMVKLGAGKPKLVPLVPGGGPYRTGGYVLWTSPEVGGGLSEDRWDVGLGDSAAPGLYAVTALGRKPHMANVPVYNLRLLLGEEHLARLRGESELLQENRALLAVRSGADRVQKGLWRLQGMLAGLEGL